MLIAVIPVHSYAETQRLIQNHEAYVDGFELRWDYSNHVDYCNEIKNLTSKPLIFTLRTKSHGGFFENDIDQTWSIISQLANAMPDFLDLEFDMPEDWFEKIKFNFPSIQIICSYHDSATHELSCNDIYEGVAKLDFNILKIAKYCQTGLQGLSLIDEMINGSYHKPRIMIGMGEYGQFTRVLGPVLGNYFDYVSVDEEHKVAPGQLSLQEVLNVYHYKTLNKKTRVFALIGHPISGSIGHIYHNQKFCEKKRNAVYVKIDIEESSLALALQIIMRLPIDGLSITMPLKKLVATYLKSNLTAVNTIKCKNNTFLGFNSDGHGALKALRNVTLKKLKILILGAGGAAAAIAEIFSQEGYQLFILNRTIEKASLLAGTTLDPQKNDIPEIDLIINTLPNEVFHTNQLWGKKLLKMIKSKHLIMDISYQQDSLFLLKAKELKCKIIPGIDMFYFQAEEQQEIWFKNDFEAFA